MTSALWRSGRLADEAVWVRPFVQPPPKLRVGLKQDSTLVSMFQFHDLVRKNVKSRNLASSKQVYCWVYTYLYYLFFLLTWIFRFLRPWSRKVIEILWPSSSWHNEELQRLIQRFDSALDEADGGTSSDDCPMISEQKRGGVGMLVRVTWRKMSTFFRNMVRNWSKLNKEVWSWLARYFQLYIVYLLFQHQPVANS